MADFRKLADDLHPLIDALQDATRTLIVLTQALGRAEESDLHKILTAVHNLANYGATACWKACPPRSRTSRAARRSIPTSNLPRSRNPPLHQARDAS